MANSIHTLQYVHHLLAMNSPELVTQSEENAQLRPKELIATVLRPCVIGMLKDCDLAWRQLTQAFVYDVSPFQCLGAVRGPPASL